MHNATVAIDKAENPSNKTNMMSKDDNNLNYTVTAQEVRTEFKPYHYKEKSTMYNTCMIQTRLL